MPAGKDEALLLRRNAFFVLDLGLYIVNSVRLRGFDLQVEGDDFFKFGKDERVWSTIVLNRGEDGALPVGRNAFLVLDLGLDIVDCVGGFDLKGDDLSGKTITSVRVQSLQSSKSSRCLPCPGSSP